MRLYFKSVPFKRLGSIFSSVVCVQPVGFQKASAARLVIQNPVGLVFHSCQDNQRAHDIIFKRGRKSTIGQQAVFPALSHGMSTAYI